jgi:hypothetical protein
MYKKLAKKQNMTIARAKAIEIMELLEVKQEGEDWYQLEDQIKKIINSK